MDLNRFDIAEVVENGGADDARVIKTGSFAADNETEEYEEVDDEDNDEEDDDDYTTTDSSSSDDSSSDDENEHDKDSSNKKKTSSSNTDDKKKSKDAKTKKQGDSKIASGRKTRFSMLQQVRDGHALVPNSIDA